jgi:PTH1 family peptidyl-tRNA hydrolase
MKFIIGLGNPGIRYQRTRHNIGRALVEYIAQSEKAIFRRNKRMNAMCAEVDWAGETVQLIYPEVFMNLSGETVQRINGYFPINPQIDLLIAVDDAALPFGGLRLRGQGSSGGHNGLKSVAQALGSEQYSRLRLGISKPGGAATDASDQREESTVPLHDYVLDVFSAEEMSAMPGFLKSAAEACRLWVEGPLERAMSAVNQRVPTV